MPTVTSIMADLKSKGKEQTRKIYARHGMAPERVFGVSVADRNPSKASRLWPANSTKPATWTPCTSPEWWPTARS